MRFSLTADQREFYKKNRFIEFEDFLTLQQVEQIKAALDNCSKKYDLWRENEVIKQWTHKRFLVEIASTLFQTMPLRLAFDLYFTPGEKRDAPLSLQESSCIHRLVGAVLLPLMDNATPSSDFPLPHKAGSALFFSPHLPIPWDKLHSAFLLIAFAPKHAQYLLEQRDPHGHLLKKFGYGFGDHLRDTMHPIVFRRN